MPVVYFFGNGEADGGAGDKALLGGKGANLAEMTRLGLPVPPGFTITTQTCNHTFQNHLGVPTVWIPLSYSACSQHAPNEHILKSLTRQGMQLVTGVYWELGETAPAAP